MDAFWRDLRFALRGLTRSPAFTAVAVLTLALGIGANTAIFSVVNTVLLRPLAYTQPEQLVSVRARLVGRNRRDVPMSEPEYHDLVREVPALRDLAAVWPININLTGSDEPERIQAAVVSFNYFSLLGVAPALGRDFTKADDQGRIGYVALISYDLWQRRFGGDRAVIGRTVRLDDDPITIIGVMPRGFRHPVESGASPMELWAPIAMDNPDTTFMNNRGARVFDLIGRIKPGATVDQFQAQLLALTGRLASRYPDAYPPALGWQAEGIPLAERVVGNVRPALLVLLGAVGFVLLIGCANVANLLLARATTRDREIAIRTAMGGSRLRLMRQLLTESVLLATLGGLFGLLIAAWGTSALGELARLYLPRARDIGIDKSVLGFTALLTLVTGLGFGIIPAFQASRPDLQSVLKDAGRGATAGAPRNRVRGALVVLEVAVALVLLAGAGLLLRSFQRLIEVEPGFNPDHLLALQVWLPVQNQPEKGRYYTNAQRRAFYDRAQAAVASVPGVRQVALVSRLPYRGRGDSRFEIEGRPTPPDQPSPVADMRVVTPEFFQAMQIPILRGRTIVGSGGLERPRRSRGQPDPREQVLAERDPDRSARAGLRSPGPDGDDRGSGRRRATGGAGPAPARGAVSLEPALSQPGDGLHRPHRGRSRPPRPRRDPSDPRGRSRPAGVRHHADGKGGVRCQRRASVLASPAHPVRRAGAPAVGHRHLRRDGLQHHPAAPRDRHPHGARRRLA